MSHAPRTPGGVAHIIHMNDNRRNQLANRRVQPHTDDDERAAIRDEGLDPDNPTVDAALRQVTATLRAHRHLLDGYPWCHTASELYLPVPPLPTFDIEHAFE